MKRCSKCLELKPATPEFFHRNASTPDGLYPYCKPCRNAYACAHRKAFPVMYRRLGREYTQSNRIIRLFAEKRGIPFVPQAKAKRCPRCKEVKPLTREYYYRNLTKSDGFQPHCKPCHREYIKSSEEKKRVRSVAGTP